MLTTHIVLAIITTVNNEQEKNMASAEQIAIANKTSRNSKAIGSKAVTPKYARKWIDMNRDKETCLILDFGAGKTAAHAAAMVADGYNCLAHEFGDNVDPRYHCELAMLNKYDVVYASNVLNVQQSLHMFTETINEIKSVLKDDGVFIANFPLNPRKMQMHAHQMSDMLRQHFSSVVIGHGSNQAPVFVMEK